MKKGWYVCDRCRKEAPAWYTLSHLTKGLWIKCPRCGTHTRSFIPNLDLPQKPSKAYIEQVQNFEPKQPMLS